MIGREVAAVNFGVAGAAGEERVAAEQHRLALELKHIEPGVWPGVWMVCSRSRPTSMTESSSRMSS